MMSLQLLPLLAAGCGWRWGFVLLIPGPVLDALAMRRTPPAPSACAPRTLSGSAPHHQRKLNRTLTVSPKEKCFSTETRIRGDTGRRPASRDAGFAGVLVEG